MKEFTENYKIISQKKVRKKGFKVSFLGHAAPADPLVRLRAPLRDVRGAQRGLEDHRHQHLAPGHYLIFFLFFFNTPIYLLIFLNFK